ncbi:PH domain-containing protein [Haloterrigena sp. SYSU A558-1]|uniref:PH domain-containing protein n=1 Tax=Haloterrigena gelatinilytica TaxID=2741724 RepID=A0ABX2LG60_9EURY|nr:PH domain-containing protein [Haloterrigena gelatinilytica]NUC74134.1 PH domain-containing protein [Haloterrigena gelatinilytica]
MSAHTRLKPDIRSIPVRALENVDFTTVAILAVMLTVLGDGSASGIDVLTSGLVRLVLLAVFVGLLQLAIQAVEWWRYELTLEEESIVVRSGILRPKRRTIPFSRIQRSTVSTTTVSRPFGLAALECETAGNPDEADLSVRYLERADAEDLQQRIQSAADVDATSAEPPDRRRVFTLRPRELALYGVTRTHTKTVLLAALAWVGAHYFEPDAMTDLRSTAVAVLEDLLPLSPAVMLGLVVLTGWLAGVALGIERMARFRLSAGEGSFRRQHGLFRTTDADVSSDRIQIARVRSNPLHRRLGLAQADIGTAGLSDPAPFGLKWPLAPLARRDVAWDLVERAVGVDRSAVRLQPLPDRARRRYVVRYALGVVALAVGTVIAQRFVPATRVIPLPLFAPLLALTPLAGHVTWSHRGYALLEDHVVVRRGFWTRRTYVVPTDTVQNLSVSQSPFQRRVDLVSVRLDVASMPFLPGVPLPDVDASVGGRLQRRLLETGSESEADSESEDEPESEVDGESAEAENERAR